MSTLKRLGVFDSGLGGLTVLNEVCKYNPGLDVVYFGDTARVPYGSRTVETINRYAEQDVRFLLSQGVEAILIACGTVSTNCLPSLQSIFSLPIVGVIDAGCQAALRASKAKRIGVIGTRATVASGAYERKLHALRPEVKVISQACPLIVPSVEAGVEPSDPLAGLICDRYFKAFEGQKVDALIMGCTHYPVYRELFQQRLPGATMLDV
ncbi:MAG: glutamate racemase, partial [Clostridia bacterium]|nr:glutamate racemase [Clostridia bacterium]